MIVSLSPFAGIDLLYDIPTASRNLAVTIRRMAADACTVLYQGAVPLSSAAYLSLVLCLRPCLARIVLDAVRGRAISCWSRCRAMDAWSVREGYSYDYDCCTEYAKETTPESLLQL